MSNWVANPGKDGRPWYVWDAEGPDHRIVFTGSMEECGAVVDLLKLNEMHEEWGLPRRAAQAFARAEASQQSSRRALDGEMSGGTPQRPSNRTQVGTDRAATDGHSGVPPDARTEEEG